MLKDIKKHPSFHNLEIPTACKQQLNNDLDGCTVQQEKENEQIISKHISLLTKIYSNTKVDFFHLSEGFDNVCYNVLTPIVKHYGGRLFQYLCSKNSIIDKNSFQGNLAYNLLDTLFNISYKTLWEEYKNFVLSLPEEHNEITENAVNELFVSTFDSNKFFSKYPVFAEIICNTSEVLTNKYKLIYEFLTQDISIIHSHFNLKIDITKSIEIEQITIGGDSHNENNFVAIIEFVENQKIVLKNRTAKPEAVLGKAIEFFLDKNIKLKSPRILEIDGHYWTDFIEYKPCESKSELADYYTRIGNLTALLYALNAIDIHYENIIACGAFPVIVDAECLFFANFDYGYYNNVLDIGLLPSEMQAGKRNMWIGGIDNAGEQNALFPNLVVDENYTLKEEKGAFKNAQNMPFLKSGETVNVTDYQNNIINGFREVYDLLVKYKNEFQLLVQSYFPLNVRYLNRPTFSYNHLLRQSLFPKYLTDESSYDWVFEWLRHNAEVNSKYYELITYEQEMQKQRFVPFFCYYTNSKDLLNANKSVVKKCFFENTAEEFFTEKLKILSEEDKKIQLRIIEMQFLKFANKHSEHFTSKDFNKQVIAKIESCILPINDTVEAFDFIEGNVKKVEINLYDGYAGYLLFLIYYRKVFQDNSVNSLIFKIYKKIVFEIEKNGKDFEIGAFLGISGCLYVFTHLFALEQNKIYLQEIEKIENLILEKIKKPQILKNDILSGMAGCIVVLYAYYKLLKKEKTKTLIIQLAELLVVNSKKIDENSIGWISQRGFPLVGYSHGNSGMGHALLLAYELSKNENFITVFKKSINFENEHFDTTKGGWFDERKELYEHENSSWCNGATGIGLARIKYMQFIKNDEFRKDIEKALNLSLQFGISEIDVLCHGNWGTIELLLYYIQNIDNSEKMTEYINKMKSFLLERIETDKIKCNNKNKLLSISFMTGLTGIAFEMLRLKKPDIVPSVLLLEPPKFAQ